jgi:hypothetical protein
LALALRPVGAVDGASEAGPRFRLRIGVEPARDPIAAPVDLVRLARELQAPEGPSCRTVATDPAGRVRVDLAGGSRGLKVRRYE